MSAPETYLLWVNGAECRGTGEPIPIECPATGEVFASCHSASEADVDAAVQAAHAAFVAGTWSRAPRHVRADVLDEAAHLLTAALPDLIALEVRQTGRVVREMQAQVPSLVRWFRYYAALLRTDERPVFPTAGQLHNWADRVPLGVVTLVTPFNHPLLIAVKKLAPALAAGNSVVLKPSEQTPLTSLALAQLLHRAGLPAGVLSVLPGPGPVVAAALAAHPLVRSIDITGGTAAGRALGAIAGHNLARFNAELGGKAPVLVFADADLPAAINGVAFGAFVASGQTCVAATRILVEQSVFDDVVAGLARKAAFIAAHIGDPANPHSSMGPLVSAHQQRHVRALVDAAVSSGRAAAAEGGGTLPATSALDGFDLSKGYFYPPTVLVSAPLATDAANGENAENIENREPTPRILGTRLWRDEAFGPVVVVVPFANGNEDEAVRLANDAAFSLGAAIWTQDLSRAFRVSERVAAGIVWVNTHHRNDPSSPWGATSVPGGGSGVGSENGREAYLAYTAAKSTVVNYARPHEARVAEDWFNEGAAAVRYG
ncbi:hypothetical protein SPBR_05793 [Sporothrix brasiliensis 5110]|uniref:aldehyde dehydrogenase (NAD(+)) n=1 Tax=Sporothrix brasiliensis 5110 TaxID=1398154 RepID=A0A0C2FS81_9PEZI|nr:uncharacterized protein SPBR_05793 [Sporothrix brasiliensis 5110]KIH93883.1 hypothetical protein SPBR_05793 [Sporothrix brasiliensis 5110]